MKNTTKNKNVKADKNPYPAGSGSAAQWEANRKWNEACERRGRANMRGQFGRVAK